MKSSIEEVFSFLVRREDEYTFVNCIPASGGWKRMKMYNGFEAFPEESVQGLLWLENGCKLEYECKDEEKKKDREQPI